MEDSNLPDSSLSLRGEVRDPLSLRSERPRESLRFLPLFDLSLDRLLRRFFSGDPGGLLLLFGLAGKAFLFLVVSGDGLFSSSISTSSSELRE